MESDTVATRDMPREQKGMIATNIHRRVKKRKRRKPHICNEWLIDMVCFIVEISIFDNRPRPLGPHPTSEVQSQNVFGLDFVF